VRQPAAGPDRVADRVDRADARSALLADTGVVGGNWGWFETRRSSGSRRRRMILSIASILAAIALLVLASQLGIASSPEITAKVAVIAGLLIAGVVLGLRPWSRS
jgi:hypothetical protein